MALNPLLGLFCPGSLLLFYSVARPWTPPLLMFCCIVGKVWGFRESELPNSCCMACQCTQDMTTYTCPRIVYVGSVERCCDCDTHVCSTDVAVICRAPNIITDSHGTESKTQWIREELATKQSTAQWKMISSQHRLTHRGTKPPWLLLPSAHW